jgi:hypothetical protein
MSMNRNTYRQSKGPGRGDFQLSPAGPRVAAGATAALAVLAATFYVFGPFADLSEQQLAAGPKSTQVGRDGQPLVLAKTGRSWATEPAAPVLADTGRPLALLATVETRDHRRPR